MRNLLCLVSEKEPIMILQDLASLLPSWNPGSWIGGFLLRDVRHDGLHEGVLGVVDDELMLQFQKKKTLNQIASIE